MVYDPLELLHSLASRLAHLAEASGNETLLRATLAGSISRHMPASFEAFTIEDDDGVTRPRVGPRSALFPGSFV